MYCNYITVQIFVAWKSLHIFNKTCYILLQKAEERLWTERIQISVDRVSQLPLYWEGRGAKGLRKSLPSGPRLDTCVRVLSQELKKRFGRSHVLDQPLPRRLPPAKSAINTSNRSLLVMKKTYRTKSTRSNPLVISICNPQALVWSKINFRGLVVAAVKKISHEKFGHVRHRFVSRWCGSSELCFSV
jgi:hypothetical protein